MWPSFTIEIRPAQGLPLISLDNESREAIQREGSDFAPREGAVTHIKYGEPTVERMELDGVPASKWVFDTVAEMFGAPIRDHAIVFRIVVRDRLYSVAAGWDVAREKTDRRAAESFLSSLSVLPRCR